MSNVATAASTRQPLRERDSSQSNIQHIRLVPKTPPQLLGLPSDTTASQARGRDNSQRRLYKFSDTTPVSGRAFHNSSPSSAATSSIGSAEGFSRHHLLHAVRSSPAAPDFPTILRKPPAKKRLQIHKDGRTFSLLRDDGAHAVHNPSRSPTSSPNSVLSFESGSYASRSDLRSDISTSYITEASTCTTDLTGNPLLPQTANRTLVTQSSPLSTQQSLVPGVREVPKTPDHEQQLTRVDASFPSPDSSIAQDSQDITSTHHLFHKSSFQSSITVSTASETSNYKTYRPHSLLSETTREEASFHISNIQPLSNSSRDTTILRRPLHSSSDSEYGADISQNYFNSQEQPVTPALGSEHRILGDQSTSDLLCTHSAQYSHESLLVPALVPRTRSHEKLGYYKSRSRESLRSRTGSITSITTVLSHREALKAVLSSGSLVHQLHPVAKAPNSWAETSINIPQQLYMNEHPHQWSSQLSTVMSISDGGSARHSQAWSDATGPRSSRHGRTVYSIGSSIVALDDSRLRGELPATPHQAHLRIQRHLSSSSVPIVESQDEYGDGITDLQHLHMRPSRRRLSAYYNVEGSDSSRTNTMRSTSSSMATAILANTIPTWARLYYGSGEHRFLVALGANPGALGDGGDSRKNSLRNGSPNLDHYPSSIYSPRKRPHEVDRVVGRGVTSGSMEIRPASRIENMRHRSIDRFRTWSMSSVWSPHLRRDRRAQRQSLWEPPSMTWSTEGSWFGRRNIQIVMFLFGFIFPLSWMIASLLPLPPQRSKEMHERDNSTTNLGESNENFDDYERQFGVLDDARHESAKWWRRLNRCMSVVGALLVAAVVILVIISLREGW